MDFKALLPTSFSDFGSGILVAVFIVALLLFAVVLFKRRKQKLSMPLSDRDLKEDEISRIKAHKKVRRSSDQKDESNTNYWA